MEKVLERREINWDQVYDYVFGEVLGMSKEEIAKGMESGAIK